MIDKLSIKNWVYPDHVLVHLRLYLVRDVVVNGVPHVLREHVLEALLVEHVIVEDLNEDVQETLVLVRIETDLEDLVGAAPAT